MVSVVKNFLNDEEILQLLEYYKNKEYTRIKTTELHGENITVAKNKDSDYNVVDSLVYKILHPKIQELFGRHTMTHGGLLESHYPYPLHVDTYTEFQEKNFYKLHDAYENTALLISLNDDPKFKTVFFDLDTPTLTIPENLPATDAPLFPDYPDLNFDHHSANTKEFLKTLKITDVYNWQAGTAVFWPRSQAHCSSNFYGTGLVKNALVLFF